jgi:predicted nucleic acid-binding protein
MKTQFFFDACSLIYLTKIKVKEKLPFLGEIMIGKRVEEEITFDLEKFDEAQVLDDNIKKGLINKVKFDPKKKNREPINLGKGEKEAINLSLSQNGIFITDDHKALNYAISKGLKPKTSEYVLLDLLKNKIISYQQFKLYFNKLANIKLLNPNIIEFIHNKANKILKVEGGKKND